MLKRPDLRQLSVAQKDALILELFDRIDALMQTEQGMQHCIDTLESQLRKDSPNSHKPPPSDGFKKVPRSLRKSSARKPGGQGTADRRLNLPNSPAW